MVWCPTLNCEIWGKIPSGVALIFHFHYFEVFFQDRSECEKRQYKLDHTFEFVRKSNRNNKVKVIVLVLWSNSIRHKGCTMSRLFYSKTIIILLTEKSHEEKSFFVKNTNKVHIHLSFEGLVCFSKFIKMLTKTG